MGNCLRSCRRCCYKRYGRRRFRGRGDEMGFLVDEDEDGSLVGAAPAAPPTSAVTEREKLLLQSRNYDALMNEQRALDAQIDEQLRRHEEELRRQEEAARAAAFARASQQRQVLAATRLAAAPVTTATAAAASANANSVQPQPKPDGEEWQQPPLNAAGALPAKDISAAGDRWLSDDEEEWNVAGGEDFGKFVDQIDREGADGGDPVPELGSGAADVPLVGSGSVADRQMTQQIEPAAFPQTSTGSDSPLRAGDGLPSDEDFVSAEP